MCKFCRNIFKSPITRTKQLKRPNSTRNAMQRHYYAIDSLLINSMRLTNDDESSIKLLHQKRDGVQNVFVKSFLTRSGQSVLLKIVSLVDLKNRVRTCWASLDQQFINKAVDRWRPRLQAVIRAHGGQIEQLFT